MGVVATVLMFVGDQCGRAGEAVEFYASSIPGVTVGKIERIPDPVDPLVDDLRRVEFSIGGTPFIAFDGAGPHKFAFTPAVSIWVDLDSEKELEQVVENLSTNGTTHMPIGDYGFSQKFAWVDDRFGVSWQLNFPFPPSN